MRRVGTYRFVVAMAFGLICLNWVFVDMWTVLRPEGPYCTHSLVLAALFGGATYVIVGQVDYAFCRSLCPSGTYFALLSRSWVSIFISRIRTSASTATPVSGSARRIWIPSIVISRLRG